MRIYKGYLVSSPGVIVYIIVITNISIITMRKCVTASIASPLLKQIIKMGKYFTMSFRYKPRVGNRSDRFKCYLELTSPMIGRPSMWQTLGKPINPYCQCGVLMERLIRWAVMWINMVTENNLYKGRWEHVSVYLQQGNTYYERKVSWVYKIAIHFIPSLHIHKVDDMSK